MKMGMNLLSVVCRPQVHKKFNTPQFEKLSEPKRLIYSCQRITEVNTLSCTVNEEFLFNPLISQSTMDKLFS